MSATVITDPMLVPAPDAPQQPAIPSPMIGLSSTAQIDLVQFAICDCCGLTEECTQAYIDRIRERYFGKWICGLCAEAIKDEIVRSERLVSSEEAMARHMSFCKKFNKPPTDPVIHLISAMRQILKKGLESRSAPGSPVRNRGGIGIPVKPLGRSESCFTTLTG